MAEGISESAYLLQQAMMESNADYNKHKKKANHEEFDRAENWENRASDAILIDGKATYASEEFTEEVEGSGPLDREVSSHETETEQEKAQDWP